MSLESLVHDMNDAARRAALARVMCDYDTADHWEARVQHISDAIERLPKPVTEIGVS